MKNLPIREMRLRTSILLILALLIGTASILPRALATVNSQSNSTQQKIYCFRKVPSGSKILNDSTIMASDGTFQHPSRMCTSNAHPPTINGWIEFGYQSGTTWLSINDNYPTPPVPSNQANQVLYFFNGIQDNNRGLIYQPVLGWGCEAANLFGCYEGGNWWWMAAEICSSNSCDFTGAIGISTKGYYTDMINGNVYQWTASDGRTWYTVVVTDTTTGRSASISGFSPGGDEAFAGAFEAYNVDDCAKLPQGGYQSENFQNIVSNPARNSWAPVVWGGSPNCAWGANFSTGW